MKVWIDTASGTWGAVENLRIVDLNDPELHGDDTDAISLELFLSGAADTEINTFGLMYGKPVTQ